MPAFIRLYDHWKTGGALETTTLQATEERFDFDVTRCRYAEMYRALGMADLGATLHVGVEQPVDDEERPFHPPDFPQCDRKLMLPRVCRELP